MLKRLIFALCFVLMATPASAQTVVYLTSGTSYTVPSNWNNSNNKIECLGGGGGGNNGTASISGPGGGGALIPKP